MHSYCGGRYIDLKNVKPEDIVVEDMAKSLDKICRYAGNIPVSVATHCVALKEAALELGHSAAVQHIALLHDLTEAWTGDMHGQVKARLTLFSDDFILDEIQDAVYEKFKLTHVRLLKQVEVLDRQALAWEAEFFIDADWRGKYAPKDAPPIPSRARRIYEYSQLEGVDMAEVLVNNHNMLLRERGLQP